MGRGEGGEGGLTTWTCLLFRASFTIFKSKLGRLLTHRYASLNGGGSSTQMRTMVLGSDHAHPPVLRDWRY